MTQVTVEVLHEIRIPAGSTLNGEVLTEQAIVRPGTATIDSALMVERGWHLSGYVEPESVGGQPVVWSSCCTGSDHDHG